MNTSTMVAALMLAVFTGAVNAATEDHIDKRFKVAGPGKLSIKADRGDIEVSTSDASEIHLEVIRVVTRGSEARANELLDGHQVTITPSENNLSISAQMPSNLSHWSLTGPQLQVRYLITIPRRFEVELSTAGGNVKLADLEGKAYLHTAGGNISAASILGNLEAKTSGGNIQVGSAKGKVKIETSGGDLKVGTVEGDLTGHTSGGNIVAAKVSGSADVSTSGGNISLGVMGGPAIAKTSGGNITASFAQTPQADCLLRTSGGEIKVTLPENASLNIDAKTSAGEVRTDFLTVKKGSSQLKSKINGGGSEFVLKTSAGNIKIVKTKS